MSRTEETGCVRSGKAFFVILSTLQENIMRTTLLCILLFSLSSSLAHGQETARSRVIALAKSGANLNTFVSPRLGLHVFADHVGRMDEATNLVLHGCGATIPKLLEKHIKPWISTLRDLEPEDLVCDSNRCDVWSGIGEDDGIHFVFHDSDQGLVLWAFGWSGSTGGNAVPKEWDGKFGKFLRSSASKSCNVRVVSGAEQKGPAPIAEKHYEQKSMASSASPTTAEGSQVVADGKGLLADAEQQIAARSRQLESVVTITEQFLAVHYDLELIGKPSVKTSAEDNGSVAVGTAMRIRRNPQALEDYAKRLAGLGGGDAQVEFHIDGYHSFRVGLFVEARQWLRDRLDGDKHPFMTPFKIQLLAAQDVMCEGAIRVWTRIGRLGILLLDGSDNDFGSDNGHEMVVEKIGYEEDFAISAQKQDTNNVTAFASFGGLNMAMLPRLTGIRSVPVAQAVAGRFEVTADGKTVWDRRTGLAWQRTAPQNTLDWQSARTYCTQVVLPGRGWRLPSHDELRDLAEATPLLSIRTMLFSTVASDSFYWSNTAVQKPASWAWVVDLGTSIGKEQSQALPGSAKISEPHSVRCVRGRGASGMSLDSDGDDEQEIH